MKWLFPDGFGTRAWLATMVLAMWAWQPELTGIEAAVGLVLANYFSSRQAKDAAKNGGNGAKTT